MAVTAGHGGHGRSRRSRPATAERFGRGAANAALANDTVARPIWVNERANGRIERPAPPGTRPHGPAAAWADRGAGSVTADMASTAGHGGHGLPRPNVQARGHDPDVTVITARTRRRGHGPCGVAAAYHAESRLGQRVTAGTDGHGVHGGSRGVCRRRVRGDVLTYQGKTRRPPHTHPIQGLEVETPPTYAAVPASVMRTRAAGEHTNNHIMA